MSLQRYGVLAGHVVGGSAERSGDTPHYQIEVQAGDTLYRVAVNERSSQSPPDLLYCLHERFNHPVTDALAALPIGFTPLVSAPGGAAVDYLRANLCTRDVMQVAPVDLPGPNNDLADLIDHYVTRAAGDSKATVYATGQAWGPEQQADKIFGFAPGAGVHDIHMNQGNQPPFVSDDGVWQDGALFLHFADQQQWVALLLAFQNQAWHTDDHTGHALPDDGTRDRAVRVVAALVNPVGPAPEPETITVINTLAVAADLHGWALLDAAKHRMPLPDVVLEPGQIQVVPVKAPVALGNNGGAITVLDAAGRKVDGVTYTAEQAAEEGRTLVF